MNSYEAERIKREAEKRKRRAEASGIKEMFDYLFFTKIKHYPRWIKNENTRKYVPEIIKDAVEFRKKVEEDTQKGIKLTLKGKDYIITFKESSTYLPDGAYFVSGDLEIYSNDKKVLALSASQSEYDKYGGGGEWSFFGIDAFIEGDWIKDFKKLETASRQNDKKNEEEYERNKKIDEAERLKKDFGVE